MDKERELIIEIVEGNEKAFSILFFSYLPVLQSFAFKFTRSEHAAEEIIQDAFIRVWLNRDQLAAVVNVKAYLYKFVSNECLSYLRKKLNQEKMIQSYKSQHSEDNNNTLESIHLNEINRIIVDAVHKLPQQRRKIYQLSRNEGKSISEIAELLHVSPNTVKNSLVVALKSIRMQLKQHGVTFLVPLLAYFLRK